jgi:phosphoglucan,water dikinase
VRARQRGTVFASCEDMGRISKLKRLSGMPAVICITADIFEITGIKEIAKDASARETRTAFMPEVSPVFPSDRLLPLDRVTQATCGAKAAAAARLKEISVTEDADFEAPSGLVIPFGVMEESLHSLPALEEEYYAAMRELDHSDAHDQRMDELLQRMSEIVMQLPLDDRIISGVTAYFSVGGRLMIRSSSNCEDGKVVSGAGLYDSVPNVPTAEVADAVRKVWGSLWNKRAFLARQNASVPHDRARMAVLIQEMKAPDISFILHTVNPINGNEDEILSELALGFGETLASGREPGTPFRMVYRKGTGDIEMLAFASYSASLVPDVRTGVRRALIDYSKVPFSEDYRFRTALGARIGHIACGVEKVFGLPLDIEGLVAGGTICLVQARPQQGGNKACRH